VEAADDRRAAVAQRVGQVGGLHDEAAGATRRAKDRQRMAVKQGQVAQRGDGRGRVGVEEGAQRYGVAGICTP
jgi:hypothetical protein